MRKVLPTVLLAVVGVGVGIGLYFALFGKSGEPQGNAPEAPRTDQEFDAAAFMARLDEDQDGRVSREEFERGYDKEVGGERFVISAKGGKAASADVAWRILDIDADGFITDPELKRYTHHDWIKHRLQTEARGLTAREWNDKFLALNGQLLAAFETNKGALARGELIAAGRSFDRKYLASWAQVRTEGGETFHAWVSTQGGKTFALQPRWRMHEVKYDPEVEKTILEADRTMLAEWAAPPAGRDIEGLEFQTWGRVTRGGANRLDLEGFIRREPGMLRIAAPAPRLRVINAAQSEITVKENAPQMEYVKRIAELKLEDAEGAAALARDCARWGMVPEALALYLRALIFRPDLPEALDYWGIESRDGHYFPRKR